MGMWAQIQTQYDRQATVINVGQKAAAQSTWFLVESWSRDLKGFPVSIEPTQRSFLATEARQQSFLPMGNVLPASLSHSVNPGNSIHHPFFTQILGFSCHKSLLVDMGPHFTQTVACSGVTFQVIRGCISSRMSILPFSQQEWNCLMMPPLGDLAENEMYLSRGPPSKHNWNIFVTAVAL